MATTEQRRIALAFAGTGESSDENTTALLNDYLGFGPEDKDGFPEIPDDDELDLVIALPVSKEHLDGGLKSVVDWTDYAELAYDVITDGTTPRGSKAVLDNAENVEEAKNVNETLIEWLQDAKDDGYEPTLVLLWGDDETPDPNAEVLLDRATALEFKVLDLTAGLDTLGFGPEDPEGAAEPEPESAPEPDPEPEKPARGRRRRSLEAEEKPLEDRPKDPDPEPEPEPEPEKPARASRKKPTVPAWEDEPKDEPTPEPENKVDDSAVADIAIKAISVARDAKGKTISPDIQAFFTFNPSPENFPNHEAVRRVALEFAGAVDALVPNGAEKAEVLRKIQEAMFWANAGIARGSAPAAAPEEGQETAEQPSRGRGRPRSDGSPAQPRTAADKAVTEIWDEAEEKWVKKGRGRLPKDAKTRLVDPETGEPIDG